MYTSPLPFEEGEEAKVEEENKKKRERCKGKGCQKFWEFFGNFIIFLGILLGIWSFQNSQKSLHFLGIPLKGLGISEVPNNSSERLIIIIFRRSAACCLLVVVLVPRS